MNSVIKKVVVTEKAYTHKDAIVFELNAGATKPQVKQEVMALYGGKLEVKSVKITTLPKKTTGMRGRVKRKPQKRAYVYVTKKTDFDFTNFAKK